jgi:hypothetical protein
MRNVGVGGKGRSASRPEGLGASGQTKSGVNPKRSWLPVTTPALPRVEWAGNLRTLVPKRLNLRAYADGRTAIEVDIQGVAVCLVVAFAVQLASVSASMADSSI